MMRNGKIYDKKNTRWIIVFLIITIAFSLFLYFSQNKKLRLQNPNSLHLYTRNEASIKKYANENPHNISGAWFSCVEITDPNLLDIFYSWFKELPKAKLKKGEVLLGGWPLEFYVSTDSSFYFIGIQHEKNGTYTVSIGAMDWNGEIILTEDTVSDVFKRFSTYSNGEYYFLKDIDKRTYTSE